MQAHAVLLIVGCLIWQDGKFIIKTVSRKESKFLKHILPNYYNYAMSAENTLIPRFFGAPPHACMPNYYYYAKLMHACSTGLIRITTASARRIRLVVMNNLLPDHVSIYLCLHLYLYRTHGWLPDHVSPPLPPLPERAGADHDGCLIWQVPIMERYDLKGSTLTVA